MRPFGSDRLRAGRGEQVVLLSARDKGWTPRVAKTLTSAEFPGTAVLWEQRYWQVIEAAPSGPAIRYVLEPWPAEHAMRLTDVYDEASEVRREAEHRAALARRSGRIAANTLGVLTGHLPATVQMDLGSELGILPARLTLISLTLPFLFIIGTTQHLVRGIINPDAPQTPLWAVALAAWFGAESLIRFLIVWSQDRPIGSAIGFFAYTIFYLVASRRMPLISPVSVGRGESVAAIPPSDDARLRDAFTLREPLLTLLTPEEQAVLAARFGFDYRAHAPVVAWIILLFAIAGVLTSAGTLLESYRISAVVSLLAALGLGVEQAVRIAALRRGPAGSFLAPAVRLFSRRLLHQ